MFFSGQKELSAGTTSSSLESRLLHSENFVDEGIWAWFSIEGKGPNRRISSWDWSLHHFDVLCCWGRQKFIAEVVQPLVLTLLPPPCSPATWRKEQRKNERMYCTDCSRYTVEYFIAEHAQSSGCDCKSYNPIGQLWMCTVSAWKSSQRR